MPFFVIPFPNIDPIAVAIGPIAIRWYALAYVAGIVGGWYLSRRLVAAPSLWGGLRRPTPTDMDDLIVWIALGIVAGGRIGYVLFYNLGSYLQNPVEILTVWRGGMSFHGGFIGTFLAILFFARSRNLPFLSILDVAGTVTPIGLFCGRLANFVNGELWGRVAFDVPWAVVFPQAGPFPRHPSQLYEAATEGLLLFCLLALAVRRFGYRRPGLVTGLFVLLYALARIGCEFFREPDAQLGFLFGRSVDGLGGGITMGMLLSLPLVAIGIVLIWLAAAGRTRRAEPVPAAA